MAAPSSGDLAQLQVQFEHAVVSCTDRCLYNSAKWAAEILNSFESPQPDDDASLQSSQDQRHQAQQKLQQQQEQERDPRETLLETRERAQYLLAKTLFDCREFDRCAAVFLPSTLPKGHLAAAKNPSGKSATAAAAAAAAAGAKRASKDGRLSGGGDGSAKFSTEEIVPDLSQKALFLSLYAKYMSGEKRRDEDSEMILGPMDGGVTVNRELNYVSRILEHWFGQRDAAKEEGQGWLEYLYGIVLAKGKNDELAKQWLIRSVHLYSYNWGAWQELSSLISSTEELKAITSRLPENIMTVIFHVYASQELFQTTEEVHGTISQIQSIFPNSSFLHTQRALLYYHSKDYEEAESVFAQLLQSDPYRLDFVDNYSNILFVMELRPKLAFLAQLATATDKFRPETCCAVGNYYSLKSEHEKAIMYFRRALTLDRNFLSAWTLMGHEYVEMKNTHAAIESYRRAVDVNRKDYRAWYALGQTYEVLEMHSYALFYYQRAASLQPYDPKMWQAVGACFGRVGKLHNGIRAYKRALVAASYYDSGTHAHGSSSASGSFGSGEGGGGGGDQPFSSRLGSGLLDPEALYQIALLYERLDDREECAAYMELTLAQEDGPDASAGGTAITADDEAGGRSFGASVSSSSGATIGPSGAQNPGGNGGVGGGGGGGGGGVGVTPTTSKARMWLARWEFVRGGFQRSMELANELCQDGVEVEDAKALVRDIRARIEREKDDNARIAVEGVERRFGTRPDG